MYYFFSKQLSSFPFSFLYSLQISFLHQWSFPIYFFFSRAFLSMIPSFFRQTLHHFFPLLTFLPSFFLSLISSLIFCFSPQHSWPPYQTWHSLMNFLFFFTSPVPFCDFPLISPQKFPSFLSSIASFKPLVFHIIIRFCFIPQITFPSSFFPLFSLLINKKRKNVSLLSNITFPNHSLFLLTF